MKSQVALLSLVSLLFSFAASAQGIENDDMYFNSKDRAKLRAAKGTEVSYTASIKKSQRPSEAEPVNPTDSYSARNINPEYEARSNSQTAQADNQDYFVNNYQYSTASNFNNWNNNFSNWYNGPWYGGNYYDPYINSWNSPYYGNAFGNPWCNPYYRTGWSSSFSYWGSSWGNYGWGMNIGYGNPYYSSWAWNYGYSPWSSYSYYGWGFPYYGYYGSRYPAQVIIVDNANYRGPVYGKRGSRSTALSGDISRPNRSSNRNVVQTENGDRPAINGRTATTRTQSDYYNRTWRYQSQQSSAPSYNNQNSNSGNGNTRSSWESNTRSSWSKGSNSGSNSSRSFDTGRSSSGGGSSSGSYGGGSSSGSRSSGRGH